MAEPNLIPDPDCPKCKGKGVIDTTTEANKQYRTHRLCECVCVSVEIDTEILKLELEKYSQGLQRHLVFSGYSIRPVNVDPGDDWPTTPEVRDDSSPDEPTVVQE